MSANSMNRLDNCPRCGRLYIRYQQPLCPQCVEKREQDFSRCRVYLRENPDTKMKELSEATGVSVRDIIQFIIEGRLILTKENPNMFYHCERCKKPIRKGRLCSNCEQRLTKEVNELVQKDQKQDPLGHKYRIFNPKK